MPSSLITIPAVWGDHTSIAVYRSRTWDNTANYSSVPRDDRPVNHYRDDRQSGFQAPHNGAYDRYDNGTVTVVQAPGFRFSAGELQTKFENFYASSNFGTVAQDAYDRLTRRMIGKVADTKVNLAVALHEAKKTSDMILQAAVTLRDAYQTFRRGDVVGVARILRLTPKTVHKNWLEYKYGWMPVLMDVKGAAEAFAQQQLGRPLRFSVQGSIEVPFERSLVTPYAAYGGGALASWTETLTGTYSARQKIWCELTNSHLSTLQQLGLTNPALLLWEAIPFSFVFDWFVSVGDYLTGLSAFNGITVRRALRSNINDLLYTYQQDTTTRRNESLHVTYENFGKTLRWHQRSYLRDPLVINPLAVPPEVKWDVFGFAKTTSSLALLRGQHARSVRS